MKGSEAVRSVGARRAAAAIGCLALAACAGGAPLVEEYLLDAAPASAAAAASPPLVARDFLSLIHI